MSAAPRNTISRSAPSARRRPRITWQRSESAAECPRSATARSCQSAPSTTKAAGRRIGATTSSVSNRRANKDSAVRITGARMSGVAVLARDCTGGDAPIKAAWISSTRTSSTLRGMIASDRQQIDALKAQVARQNDQIDELEHNSARSDRARPPALNDRIAKLEAEVKATPPARRRPGCAGRRGRSTYQARRARPAMPGAPGVPGAGRWRPARRKRLGPPTKASTAAARRRRRKCGRRAGGARRAGGDRMAVGD